VQSDIFNSGIALDHIRLAVLGLAHYFRIIGPVHFGDGHKRSPQEVGNKLIAYFIWKKCDGRRTVMSYAEPIATFSVVLE
jgi:hypothetical protein